jgi:ABC-type lipoprotein release transport system permease subunit
MITQIAWRNVWRNKVRSLVVIASVAVGIWASTFIAAFSSGMRHRYVETAIHNEVSHIQVHARGYLDDPELSESIPDAGVVVSQIKKMPGVKSVSSRLLVNAMAATASTSTGVLLRGIDTLDENNTTGIGKNLVEGSYLSGATLPVFISKELAEKLHVKLKHKIVFTFQDAQGNMTSAAFRVTGIFKTNNSTFDLQNVFLRDADLSALLKMDGEASEIAILLNNDNEVPTLLSKLKTIFPKYDVKDWKQIAPELALTVDSLNETLYMFILIIVLALVFGIVNTMLMAVLERTHEIGMLMAIGMNRKKLFRMIMTETFYLSLVGTPVGLLLAYITIVLTGKYGISLALFAQGLSSFGISKMVYPELEASVYGVIAVFIFAGTVLASFYPAIRALKLNPTDAMRS